MKLKRREFLASSAAAGFSVSLGSTLSRAANGTKAATAEQILVCVYQRGAADALNMVPPYAESRYYSLRPTLAVPAPGSGNGAALDLDGFFGMHPSMSELKTFFDSGDLAIIQAAGSPHESHSHFDAQDLMEWGYLEKNVVDSGWIGRHLESMSSSNTSPFRALGMGGSLQLSLQGAVTPVAMRSIEEFDLVAQDGHKAEMQAALELLYHGENDLLDQQVQQTFEAVDLLKAADPLQFDPENGAIYPDSSFGEDMKQVAQLIKSGLGVEVACVDTKGWDHHDGEIVLLDEKVSDLSAAMAAFHADMGDRMDHVTVVVMTEFGRRAYENASGGTDHGHGGLMMALGAGVNGGQVFGNWPGLEEADLYGLGDLEVTTDFRTVLGEMLVNRFGCQSIETVFPGFEMPTGPGVFIPT